MRRALDWTYAAARRLVIGVVGGTVVLIGTVMLLTPGPALVVIPVGLLILSVEFAWARRWLHALRDRTRGFVRRGSPPPPGRAEPAPGEAPD